MSRNLRRAVVGSSAAVLVVTAMATVASPTARAADPCSASAVGVTVCGAQVRLDGVTTALNGVIFENFQYPEDVMQACRVADGTPKDESDAAKGTCARHIAAREYYDGTDGYPSALSLARTDWHANTIRFNVNQAALDQGTDLAQYETTGTVNRYAQDLKAVVTKATDAGFVANVALFYGRNKQADYINVPNTGKSLNDANPDAPIGTMSTLAAMQKLTKLFSDNPRVLLEVVNEPKNIDGRDNTWNSYINDTPSSNETDHDGAKLDGLNDIIASARTAGETEPIIVQGLGGTWGDYPGGITDNNIIYAAHPWFAQGLPQDVDWAYRFGDFAANHPMVLTAWQTKKTDEDGDGNAGWCTNNSPALPQEFLRYVRARTDGLIGFAFDVGGSMTNGFYKNYSNPDAPTSTNPNATTCAPTITDASGHTVDNVRGSGNLIQQLFAGTIGAQTTDTAPSIGSVAGFTNGDYFNAGQTINVTVNANDPDPKDTLSYQVFVSTDEGATYSNYNFAADTPGDYRNRKWAKSFALSFNNSGHKYIKFVAYDRRGASDTLVKKLFIR